MAPGRSLSPRDREPRKERSKSRDRGREAEHRSRKRGRSTSRERDAAGRDKDAKRSREDTKRHRSRSRERKRSRSRDRKDGRDKERRDKDKDRTDRNHRDKPPDRDREERRRGSDRKKEDMEEGEAADGNLSNGKAAKKAEPLALEELLSKRKQEMEAQAKPVFMSKKQREELALQRRQEEAQAQRALQEERRKAEAAILHKMQQEEAERRRDEDRRKRTHEREKEKELEMIKQQYLGGDKVKKKVLKGSEKFRFNFDWGAEDDTSKDLNPLYNSTHQASLLFGRGMRAGIDRREQKKQAAEQEKELLRKLREAQGIAETKEDRKRDRDRDLVADLYDKADMKVEKHWTEKKRGEMTERDWRIFREDYNISYRGVNPSAAALPIRNWEEANLPKELMKAIEKQGYKKPSPIQMAAIPLGLQQRDVIGIAETGSGKTAAFVLPMLVYIEKQPVMTEEVAVEGPFAVVLAPTRELAQQIEEEAAKLAAFTPYRMVSVVGGQNIEDQGFKLRKGCEIVIATPGRLIDCLEKSYAVLNQCNYVVLDEADRMIDMGFEPQVMGVLDAMPSSNLKPESEDVELESNRVYRTTYMFSATMPPAVERLARKYLRRPVVVNIGSAGKVTDNVTQIVRVAKENDKPNMLQSELENETFAEGSKAVSRVIVFVNTKRQCDNVSKQLERLEYSCTVLHGGKTQDQREASLAGFRETKYDVLVATDVAGRGIDVPEVSMVINYDMPGSIEQYTHRIGRTGRAGRKGRAITFVTMSDTDLFYDLKKLLEESGSAVPPQIAHHEAARVKPGSVEGRRRDQTVYAK